MGGVDVQFLWSASQFVGVAFECGLHTPFDGWCSRVLKDSACCLVLVVVIMVAMCLREDGYAALSGRGAGFSEATRIPKQMLKTSADLRANMLPCLSSSFSLVVSCGTASSAFVAFRL
jgi:hypothetical protein